MLANVDSLTELPNRRRFMELLAERTAAEGSFLTAILDLDHFKDVNDSEGTTRATACSPRSRRRCANSLARVTWSRGWAVTNMH